ncbi:MAG TPA: hypothetical protein VH186_25845 [Chloroflexia bacterium]|nr:hypothetical protein [Chloroflexia bacterium]
MPSPNNVTELVIFTGGAVVVVLLVMVASRFTRFGKKLTGDWKPGPVDIASLERPRRPREKYVDPLARINLSYIYGSAFLILVVLFAYYFIMKSSFGAGN